MSSFEVVACATECVLENVCRVTICIELAQKLICEFESRGVAAVWLSKDKKHAHDKLAKDGTMVPELFKMLKLEDIKRLL